MYGYHVERNKLADQTIGHDPRQVAVFLQKTTDKSLWFYATACIENFISFSLLLFFS